MRIVCAKRGYLQKDLVFLGGGNPPLVPVEIEIERLGTTSKKRNDESHRLFPRAFFRANCTFAKKLGARGRVCALSKVYIFAFKLETVRKDVPS